MPTITLSATTCARLKRYTRPGAVFVRKGTKNDDGTFDVPVSDDVFDAICKQRQKDESFDEVVLRVMNHYDNHYDRTGRDDA